MPRSKRTDNIVSTFWSGNRVHTVRAVDVNCARCRCDFVAHMTTKAPKYCPECVEIVEKEKRKRDHERTMQRRAAGTPVKAKKKRKIPYAGFDPKEKHYD